MATAPTAVEVPVPDPSKAFTEQDEVVLLACCIFGEARNQSTLGKIGVACVVRNRVLTGRFGHGYTGVILRPFQFSSFNGNDPNRAKLMEPLKHESAEVWASCYTAAYVVHAGSQPDITQGAVFYYSKPLKSPPMKKDGTCAWGSVASTVVIGGLSFWREA